MMNQILTFWYFCLEITKEPSIEETGLFRVLVPKLLEPYRSTEMPMELRKQFPL